MKPLQWMQSLEIFVFIWRRRLSARKPSMVRIDLLSFVRASDAGSHRLAIHQNRKIPQRPSPQRLSCLLAQLWRSKSLSFSLVFHQ
jgi:hypothetical protein